MGGTDESGSAMQGGIRSTFGARPQNQLDLPNFNASQTGLPLRQLPQTLSPGGSENSHKRPGIPPSHPNNSIQYSQLMGTRPASRQPGTQNLSPGPSHSRSLSQPTFFALDSLLPPLSPSPYREPSLSSLSDPISKDVYMEESAVNSHAQSHPSPVNGGKGLPPRRGHRRSNSDGLPLGFSAMIQPSPQLIPIGSQGIFDRSFSGRENVGVEKPIQLVMKGELKRDRDGNNITDGTGEGRSEGEVMDDLFNELMNLDNIDKMNSSGTEEKDLDSRASGSKTNGCDSSDNEVESCIDGCPNSVQGPSSSLSNEKREGKRIACGDIKPTVRHCRSLSVDSYIGNLLFDDESPKLPPIGTQASQNSPSSEVDGNSTKFCVELGNAQFNEAELEKIKENVKLAEIALSDPKRAKRILANRQSAARSKERKMRYTADLEHKAQTLQTENVTLSNEVAKLQRESIALKNENNELKFRLQAMEQESKLKNALNEALSAEVQHLRLAAAECGDVIRAKQFFLTAKRSSFLA
ncbi:Transcription factor VIP1 [Morella rubra]|uniref:Transcription factor VIP1 n=1 Tax=Morella rubra TaxID=262757 RepID=A0A6A1UTH2_9ROSI|nr:Transcription factor VIP1 [Morella rubra]